MGVFSRAEFCELVRITYFTNYQNYVTEKEIGLYRDNGEKWKFNSIQIFGEQIENNHPLYLKIVDYLDVT